MPFVTTHMHEIRPRLWLGNKDAEAILLRDLQNLGITHILQVGAGQTMPPSHEKNLKYCSVKALDAESEDLLVKLQENRALEFIDECLSGGGGILVHCFAGMSRSATTVVAYIMGKDHLCFEDALVEVMLKRSIIAPNRGFCKQLRVLQEQCDGQLSRYHPDMLQGVEDISYKHWLGLLARVRERARQQSQFKLNEPEDPGSPLPLAR